MLERAVKTFRLSRAAARLIERRFADTNLPTRLNALAAWVTGFLISPAACGSITAPTPDLVNWYEDADWMRLYANSTFPAATASLTGGRYLSIYGRRDAFDLEDGSPVDRVPGDWVETRVFNLSSLLKSLGT